MRVLALVVVFLAALASAAPASAEGVHAAGEREVDYVIVEPSAPSPHRAAGLARTIYLNRCADGCTVGDKREDPRANQSSIVKKPGTLSPFPFGDQAWTTLVGCVKNAYDLYDVAIDHVEVLVAGFPTDVGFGLGTLGISPLASDCSPLRNVISFVFAEMHNPDNQAELCATVVHESGHTFGLDHALQCRDPMTYLTGCGDKLFLNIESPCGEFRHKRNCRCTSTQNSHVKLMNELGPSGRKAQPSETTIERPLSVWDGGQIVGLVSDSRWVRSIELWINGFRWEKLPHQVVEDFRFLAPDGLSDGVLDIEVRGINDVGLVGTGRITLVKGAPCVDSTTCQATETCNQGRCVFPAPTRQLGEVCDEDSDCASWACLQYNEGSEPRCATSCSVGLEDSECPSGYACVKTDSFGAGRCWPEDELPDEGGCCNTSGQPPSALAILVVLGGLFFFRRRRK
jgi:MYXO-CTERM domain-containing protein